MGRWRRCSSGGQESGVAECVCCLEDAHLSQEDQIQRRVSVQARERKRWHENGQTGKGILGFGRELLIWIGICFVVQLLVLVLD